MSLPLLHAGRTNPGLSAALDLRFALDKSLTAYRGPTPSFSRASTGSYFDGSGVLRYAALNIFPYSEDANLNFSKDTSTVSSNVATSPDGKLTADKLVEGSGATNATLWKVTSSGKIVSIYAKKSERDFLFIGIDGIGGCYFNLNLGSVGSSQVGSSGQIESVGNGWYRCSLKTTTAGGIPFVACSPTDSGSGVRPSYTGNGSSGIFLWGAMFENSEYLSPYAATNGSSNAGPRFNHTFNGTSWVSRGLLVEEQRTNIVTNSEQFNNTAWTANGSNADVSTNLITAPDGAQTADKLFETNVNGGHYLNQTASITTGNSYTFTIYVKKENRSWLQIAYNSAAFGLNAWANFDVNNGVVGNKGSSATANITSVGSGWYRCSITATSTATATSGPVICLLDTDVNSRLPSYLGDGSSGLYIWGAQLEAGAFPTSYIPTTTAAVTRSADVCQITGGDFSGFWNATEGAIAYEADSFSNSQDNQVVFQASDGTLNNQYQSARSQNNAYTDIGFWVKTGNVWQSLIATSSGAWNQNLPNKNAMAYKVNDFAFSNAGSAVLTDTSGTIPTVDRINIGASVTSVGSLNGHIARLRYYRKRLPNETLQLLSEPDPTLNLQFALNKTLTPVAGPAPSFSRASAGTYFNASGVLTSASINTPRFDHVYSGGQWVSRGLLIEEQGTNNCYFSNTFSNAAWEKYDSSISSSGTGPDGNTSSLLTENTANGPHWLRQQTSASVASGAGVSVTASIFVKANGRNVFGFGFDNSFAFTGKSVRGRFDLSDGSFANEYNCDSYSITNVGNGWYRLSVTSTAIQAGIARFDFFLYNSDTSGGISYIGDGSSGVYLFGAQIEQGAFPTSYIPTTSSSVTRSADVCQITGTSFGSMWNQGEGSFLSEVYPMGSGAIVNQGIVSGNDGTFANVVGQIRNVSNLVGDYGAFVRTGNSTQVSISRTAGSMPAFASSRAAFGYKVNDFADSLNGVAPITDTVGTVPTVNRLTIGDFHTGANTIFNGCISQIIYYPARLTNTKLQQLST